MKKIVCLLCLALAMAASGACAQIDEALPQGVLDAISAERPGYDVLDYDGWGDETRGQYALVVSKDGDNVLCIAEKGKNDAAYVLTIDNTDAVYDGDRVPSVMIDSGGDSLFYTYSNERGDSLHVHAVKMDGAWSDVDVTLYEQNEGGFRSVWSALGDGLLRYEELSEDENGNVLDRFYYVPLLVTEEGEARMLLEQYNLAVYDPDPGDGMYGMALEAGFSSGFLQTKEDMLEQLDFSRVHVAAVIDSPVSGRYLDLCEWNGERYMPIQILGMDEEAYIDEYHAGEGAVLITNGKMMYSVLRAQAGKWYLTGIDPQTQRSIGPDWACMSDIAIPGRNDGYLYGDTWWDDFEPGRIDLPKTFDEVLERMDTSAYALVVNPNPEDRLHLRERADRGSKSLGKFFNRTPVRVLERGETWTKVRIGTVANLTGYMMTKYLAFTDEEKAAVACAFPQKHFSSEYYVENGLRLLAQPDPGGDYNGLYFHQNGDMIIGVYGDEYYIVLRSDGSIGYVIQIAFWDGNG